MRLNRLDFIRYGRFDGAEIVLPRPDAGAPDVTIIYGPNESGKSTAFNGFLELLFGLKSINHPYAFKFDRNDLLVGAELNIPGRGVTVLRRNGKRTQSLLDHQDRPVDEAILSSALHGLSMEAYVERFSLNDEGLRKGGDRIAEAKGDLGQLLHAGVSGLTSMAATLENMVTRADKFHKKSGRGTALKTGKDRLKEIHEALRTERFTPDRERTLRNDKETAQKAFEHADADLTRARKRQAAGAAAQTWYDKSEEIRKIDESLAGFPEGPSLKKGTDGQIATLVTTVSEKAESIASADDRIARHERVISENEADPAAAHLVAELEELDQIRIDGASLTSRADTARSDMEKRTGERDDAARQIKKILAVLAVPDEPAEALVLTTEELETLAEAVQVCQTTEGALRAASNVLKTARYQLGDAPSEPKDLSHLQLAYDAWQKVSDVSGLEHNLGSERARLAKSVSGLPASWQTLIENGLPARESLDEVLREWNTLTANIASATEDLEGREADYKAARAKREADESAPDAIDAAATEETRRQRDTAWQSHRNSLSDETAERFEEAMYADDGARTNYLMGTEARKQLANSRAQESAAKAARDTAKDKFEVLNGKRDALAKRVVSLARALGFPDYTEPAAFAARLTSLTASAEIATDVTIAENVLEDRTKRRKAAFDDLFAAARLVDIEGEKSDLPERVGKALTLQENVRQTWENWRRGERNIADYEEAETQAETGHKAALYRLETLTSALPLPDRSAAGVKTALPQLRTLQQLQSNHKSLAGRVEALERALSTLATSAARLAEILEEPFNLKDDPLPIINRARARVTKAAEADRVRKREEEILDKEVTDRKRALIALDEAQTRLDELFEEQGGENLSPTERGALLAERDELRKDRADADNSRNQARDGVDRTLFVEELTRLPDVTREAELQQELDDAQTARDAAFKVCNEKERLYEEAYNAADNSDLITDQATILEELRNGARQAAVARLGILAARGALKRLAAERSSAMLKDVEEAFVTMTSKEWEKVVVWSETEGEKLVGIKPGGDPVKVENMSTGTMGQLYFALRLAGYRSFARDPGPLPMVLDDIMETFDDTRASAALNLCAEIGRSGQAIIFTHHAHLVELARKSIPGVSVVEMPH
ncbi:AAA family ATPase [Brucella anthropi]|uniref:AAA family ATPase n=1 Tax=Brucella anthropi TaxID=529 RepID=UPI002166305D|nr:AAA family ATPase [Brucella anthropi]UVV70944.1 AAA family ATPase [Brucella anthropi]